MSRPPLSRILYVEDEADIREIVQLALSSVGGYVVEACASGTEAMAKAADFKPDLILLSIQLPDKDWFSVCKSIKKAKALKEIPVITVGTQRTSPTPRIATPAALVAAAARAGSGAAASAAPSASTAKPSTTHVQPRPAAERRRPARNR